MSQPMGKQPLSFFPRTASELRAGRTVDEHHGREGGRGGGRTTLGPKGMDKNLVDSTGSVVVTNDGVTILKEMDIEYPAANMIVEVAETQEDEVGDERPAPSSSLVNSSEKAEDLLEQVIDATTLAQGTDRPPRRRRKSRRQRHRSRCRRHGVPRKIAERR